MPAAEKTRSTPWDEMYDALESAITSAKAIINGLEDIPELKSYCDTMEQILHEMQDDFEPLERRAQAEYDAEIAALTRDYYRSVI